MFWRIKYEKTHDGKQLLPPLEQTVNSTSECYHKLKNVIYKILETGDYEFYPEPYSFDLTVEECMRHILWRFIDDKQDILLISAIRL